MLEFTPKEMSVLDIIGKIAEKNIEIKESIAKRDQNRIMMSHFEGLMKNEDCKIQDDRHSVNTYLDMLVLQMRKENGKEINGTK